MEAHLVFWTRAYVFLNLPGVSFFLLSFSVFLSLFLHVSTCPCQDKPAKVGDCSAALTPVNHRCWTLLASHKTSYACFVLSVSSLISFSFLFFSPSWPHDSFCNVYEGGDIQSVFHEISRFKTQRSRCASWRDPPPHTPSSPKCQSSSCQSKPH